MHYHSMYFKGMAYLYSQDVYKAANDASSGMGKAVGHFKATSAVFE